MATDARATAAKLIAKCHELHEQQGLILKELDAVISGGDGVGVRLKRLRATFGLLWETRYHTPYAFAFAKDNAQLKRLLSFTDEEIERRMAVYVTMSDVFYTKNRHPFGVFVSQFNVFAAPSDSAGRPTGCDCIVACASEAAHTRRHLESLA